MEIIIPLKGKIKYCIHCSNLFITQRMSRKYCCNNCKQMAYLQRKGFATNNQPPVTEQIKEVKTTDVTINVLSASTKQPQEINRKDGIIKRFFKKLW